MKPKPTPKPVNKNLNQVKGNQEHPEYLKEFVIDISNADFEVIQEELGFHKEKFDTHRDKINEIATELNTMSEHTHERLLELAEINRAICQVTDNKDSELEEAIKWNRRTLWVLAITQGIIIVKLFLNL